MTIPNSGTNDPFGDFSDFESELGADEDRDELASRVARKYERVLRVTASLSSTLELTELLNNIVDGIIHVTGCRRGLLMLKESDGSFSAHIGRTSHQEAWDGDPREISQTVVSRVVRSGQPFIESNLSRLGEKDISESIHAQHIRSAVCLPLSYKDKLVGVIYGDADRVVPELLEADHSILSAFASQAALAIENARQHGELLTRRATLEEQNLSLRRHLGREVTYAGMVSRNKRMLEVFESVERIGPSHFSVLLLGESGTGKELVARAIHSKSRRSDGAFIAVNSASLPAGLVESVLFGHKRGAFTNAVEDKAGVFELADGGTLFLDEIGDMPLELQPKILRAVQEKEVTRVGDEGRVRHVDVRIIAATHVDLGKAVAESRFREDLYYRLNVAQIVLPPLRDRREDIVPLARHFLSVYAEEHNQPLPELTPAACEYLTAYPWAGNVRQLRSAVEVGIIYQDEQNVIDVDALRRYLSGEATGVSSDGPGKEGESVPAALRDQIAAHEEQIIRRTLETTDFNITAAARLLEISRQQLHNKIRRFGIVKR